MTRGTWPTPQGGAGNGDGQEVATTGSAIVPNNVRCPIVNLADLFAAYNNNAATYQRIPYPIGAFEELAALM
jgi:hypothetical protein